jgi:hypothetical protein
MNIVIPLYYVKIINYYKMKQKIFDVTISKK